MASFKKFMLDITWLCDFTKFYPKSGFCHNISKPKILNQQDVFKVLKFKPRHFQDFPSEGAKIVPIL